MDHVVDDTGLGSQVGASDFLAIDRGELVAQNGRFLGFLERATVQQRNRKLQRLTQAISMLRGVQTRTRSRLARKKD